MANYKFCTLNLLKTFCRVTPYVFPKLQGNVIQPMKKPIFACLVLFTGLFFFFSVSFSQTNYELGKAATDNNLKVDYFTKALNQEKKDNWTYYRRAWAYMGLKRYTLALQDFKMAEAAEGSLDKAFIYSSYAWCWYDLGNNPKAREYAEKTLKTKADVGEAHNSLGWISIAEGKFAEAETHFSNYIAFDPENSRGYYDRSNARLKLGNYAGVLEDCDKGLQFDPENEGLLERKSLALMRTGREAEAIAMIGKSINYKPDDPISLSRLGRMFYNSGDYRSAIEYDTRAIQLYEKKIETDPKFIETHKSDVYNIYMSRGDAYEMLEEYPHAHQNYRRASEIDPKDPRAWIETGELQTFQENFREAAQAYEKAFEIDPEYKEGWVNLGFCYSHLGDDKHAILAYTRGIKADPENGLLYNNRGFEYLEAGDFARAEADLQKAIQVEPDIVMSHVSLGEYYYARKQYGEAIAKFNEAINMENGGQRAYHAAYYTRGLCHLDQEQYQPALVDFEAALNMEYRDGLSYEKMGICYFQLEKMCEAYKAFKKALEYKDHLKDREVLEASKYLGKLTQNPCK